MRFAVVSDIHGNLPALEAVIADIARRGVASVVNLGDSLSGPLWPVETAERLIALAWPSIAGNHERQLLRLPVEAMGQTDAATAAVLPCYAWDWIASLPSNWEIGGDVLFCHGTPTSDHTYWLHKGQRGRMREARFDEIDRDVSRHGLILCGHTHLPRAIALADGRRIANPGSVGLPAYEDGLPSYNALDAQTPHARYLIAERVQGSWQIELHAVAYDFEISARRAEAADRPTWAHALRTGRAIGWT